MVYDMHYITHIMPTVYRHAIHHWKAFYSIDDEQDMHVSVRPVTLNSLMFPAC